MSHAFISRRSPPYTLFPGSGFASQRDCVYTNAVVLCVYSSRSLRAHLKQHVGEITVGELEVPLVVELEQRWAVRVLVF